MGFEPIKQDIGGRYLFSSSDLTQAQVTTADINFSLMDCSCFCVLLPDTEALLPWLRFESREGANVLDVCDGVDVCFGSQFEDPFLTAEAVLILNIRWGSTG